MKNPNIPITIAALFAVLLLSACNSGDHHHHPQGAETEAVAAVVFDSPEAFKNSIGITLEAYFDLKDALVLTDQDAAAQKADVLAGRINDIDDEGLEGDAADIWAVHRDAMLNGALSITGEGNVEDQRFHFEALSEAFIETVKRFQPVGYTVYEQMCPMVRGGQANWLSREEQIANPYHGDRMLRCGSVVARI